jgi:hypothetical protein
MRPDDITLPPTVSVHIPFATVPHIPPAIPSTDRHTMTDDRTARYLTYVRWYPAAWRARNSDAIVAVLMDDDDAHGRITPTLSNRLSLMAAGLYERVLAPERPNRFSVGALILGLVFSVFYLGVITWAPGITFAGTFGPFTNPTVLASLPLVAALVCALLSRARTARVLALTTIPVVGVIAILADVHSWLGPGPGVVAIYTALAVASALPIRSTRDAARAAGASVLMLVCVGFASLLPLPVGLVQAGIANAAVAALLGAVALIWPLMRAAFTPDVSPASTSDGHAVQVSPH